MKVSIITVSWNSNKTIRDTIDSVVSQTYPNIEYIVIDGGSADGTVDTVKNYGNKISQFISEPDEGIYDAMNKGIELATGDIIGILNSDDHFSDKTVISKIVEKFHTSKAGVILSNVCLISPEGRISRHYKAKHLNKKIMRFGFAPPHPGAFIAKSVYSKVGLYDTSFNISADFDLLLRISLASESVAILDMTSVNMLEGGISTNGLKSYYESTKQLYSSLRKNGVSTNIFLVLCRLPLKFFSQKVFKD